MSLLCSWYYYYYYYYYVIRFLLYFIVWVLKVLWQATVLNLWNVTDIMKCVLVYTDYQFCSPIALLSIKVSCVVFLLYAVIV